MVSEPKREKLIIFDEVTGRPKELRYYEDTRLVARLEIIPNADGDFIGLRELDPEKVAPQSWIGKFFKKKPVTERISITTIDFIGLINWINTIKTIKTINQIDNISSIDLIDQITKIGEITTIRDLQWQPKTLIQNYSFEQDALGWNLTGGAVIDTTQGFGTRCCKLPSFGSRATQRFGIPIKTNWVTTWMFWMRGSLTIADLHMDFYYTDDTSSTHSFSPTIALQWQRKTVTPTINKWIESIEIYNFRTDSILWFDEFLTIF